jgi:putative oxidoreductase
LKPAQLNLALLALRIASGLVFLYHGSAIFFGAFGGPGPQGFSAYMHMPVIVGYLVGLAQFAGGLAMLTGAFIRIGAACIIIVMLGAILLVHLPHGFDLGKNGYEYALTQLLIAVALLLTGAGDYSLAGLFPASWRKL